MRVGWHLGGNQRHVLRTGLVAELSTRKARSRALADRNAALEIGNAEGAVPVAAVSRSQKGKERLILVDTQHLPVAQCPAARCKVAAEHSDFTDKWIHVY